MAATKTSPKMQTVECPRCAGSGHFRQWGHIYQGKCFRCHGAGTVQVRVKSEAQLAREAARHAAQIADRDARIAEGNRKTAAAVARYTGDSRLRVTPDHSWFPQHCQELAMKDGVWETL